MSSAESLSLLCILQSTAIMASCTNYDQHFDAKMTNSSSLGPVQKNKWRPSASPMRCRLRSASALSGKLRVLTFPCLVAFDFLRSEEHTSELQSLLRISYAVFCLKKKNT